MLFRACAREQCFVVVMAVVAHASRVEQMLVRGPTALSSYDSESFPWMNGMLLRRCLDWNTLVALIDWDPRVAENLRLTCDRITDITSDPSTAVLNALTAVRKLADLLEAASQFTQLSMVWRTSWKRDALVRDELSAFDRHVVDSRTLQEWQCWIEKLDQCAQDSHTQALAVLNRYKAMHAAEASAKRAADEVDRHDDVRPRSD